SSISRPPKSGGVVTCASRRCDGRASPAVGCQLPTRPVTAQGMARDFRNGYIGTYTAGVERNVGDVKVGVSYVGTVGIKLAEIGYPNGYAGADPARAPYTGYGPIVMMTNR